jgi:predicted ribosome quality control (RQC) complex YloA/Tae2 family protein
MRVDALVLRAVAGELAAQIVGGRIDPIIAPTPQAVAMGCYNAGQNRWLLISAHPQLARVHLIPTKPQKLITEPSAFVMLLRKYLEGARVHAVRAVPWERIIELDVGHASTPQLDVTVIVEVMGNLSNIMLVDRDRMILGALHPVSLQVNHYRAIQAGQPYVPPPPQTRPVNGQALPRLNPTTVTGADLAPLPVAAGAGEPPPLAWRVVAAQLAGGSPDFAQEVVCRALGDPQAQIAPDDLAAWQTVAAMVRELATRAEAQEWAPTALLDDEGNITDGALWPPCVAHAKPQQPMPSVNALLAAYFAAREWRDALGGAGGDLRRSLKATTEKLQKKRRALQAELAALQEGDRLRREGELLLAFATEIPEHAPNFTIPDLGDGAGPTTITLDPRHSAVENANLRFARYHKMRRAAEKIPQQIARAELDLARVAQLQTDLDLAETLPEIGQVRAEIVEARLSRIDQDDVLAKQAKKAQAKGKAGAKGKTPIKQRIGGDPLRLTSPDGFIVYVGKNSHQNEHVTFDLGASNDLWLHARGVPGAHVIIKAGGRPVPATTLTFAASLAAGYSQSRTAASVPVDYTEQRHVRHRKDGGPGMVIFSHEKTIMAAPKAAGS